MPTIAFGASPLLAMFQGLWLGNSIFVVRSAWGCKVTCPGESELLIELEQLPPTVIGATNPDTTGVSDSTILCQIGQQNLGPYEVDITYGPKAAGPALNANQILVTLNTGEGTSGQSTNGVIFQCQDGSFTPEAP